MTRITCRQCGESFTHPRKRGRHPLYCGSACAKAAEAAHLEAKRQSPEWRAHRNEVDRQRYAASPEARVRKGAPALCHPERPRKTKTGLCDSCYRVELARRKAGVR